MSNFASHAEISPKIYPEREEPHLSKVEQLTAAVGGYLAARVPPKWQRFNWIVKAAEGHGPQVAQWNDKQIRDASRKLGQDLRHSGFQRDTVAQTFALIREVAARTVGLRPLDVQLIGGAAMLKGMVAEMETGEGKTLTATLPAGTLALAGVAVHIITVNDYLAGRDAAWMAPIYEALGLTVGTIVHGMDPGARQAAYRCHVTYCTNKELAFDYLRDRIVLWDRPSALRMQVERLFVVGTQDFPEVAEDAAFAVGTLDRLGEVVPADDEVLARRHDRTTRGLSLIHISEPTRQYCQSRIASSA